MDQQSINERDLVDLEIGETGYEHDTKDELATSSRRAKSMLRLASGVLSFDGSDKGDCSTNSYGNSENSNNIELLIDSNVGGQNGEHVPLIEKKPVKEKRKTAKPKKAPKPPRPPKGPILDTADMKLVKEISELAMKKRVRIERMKALKKMKAANSSSSSSSSSSGSSLTAMVVTILFFLIIIFQGIFSQTNSSANIQGSPGPEAAANGLISVQLYRDHLPTYGDAPSSESPNSLERPSGSEVSSAG